MREKSYVEDIDRSIYDFKDDEKDAYKVKAGLTPEIVQKISDEKKDPAWMQLFRLRSLQIYNQMPIPDWMATRRVIFFGPRIRTSRQAILRSPCHSSTG